jgi:hypothetical protein
VVSPLRPTASDPAHAQQVVERVKELATDYEPPSFDHVPDPDTALFLCAIDHRTGYRARYLVGGRGPFEGSALLWAVGVQAASRHRGLLTADSLRGVTAERVAELFRIGGETVADPERRAALWRDLGTGVERDHGGEAEGLLAVAEGRLAGGDGLLALLARYDAYADPLQKKSMLFAKICARRGWLEVHDSESWEVCSDNVLMRLALRSGLIHPGSVEEVRAATRQVFKQVAEEAETSPPVLDDLLWERGRGDPDLLGTDGGDLREPPRDPESHWY